MSFAVRADAGGPVARVLDQKLAPGTLGKLHVIRPVKVGARRPGDVRDDVLLELAGADRNDVTCVVVRVRRRHVDAGARRLPGEPHARAAERRCGGSGGIEPAEPVLEHGARRGRVGRREKWQDENVAVPEDVSAVPRARESTGPHGGLAGLAYRAHQMEEGKAHEALQFVIALDPDVGGLPALGPAPAVLREQAVEAERLRVPKPAERVLCVGHRRRIRHVRRQAVEAISLDPFVSRSDETPYARGLAQPGRSVHRACYDGSSLRSLQRLVRLEQPARAVRAEHGRPRPGERGEQQAIELELATETLTEETRPQVELTLEPGRVRKLAVQPGPHWARDEIGLGPLSFVKAGGENAWSRCGVRAYRAAARADHTVRDCQ